MICPECQVGNATGARFCASCGSNLPSEPVTSSEVVQIGRAPSISWILAGIGAILYGVSYLSFITYSSPHPGLARVCNGLGGLGFLLIFVAVVMSLGTTKKKFGIFPVILVLIGSAAFSGIEFSQLNTGFWTTTGFNVWNFTQGGAFVVFGLAGLVTVGTRSSS